VKEGPVGAPKSRLLDRVRAAIPARHDRRTEKAYVACTRWYSFFRGKGHALELDL
jgi:hypothetical protein